LFVLLLTKPSGFRERSLGTRRLIRRGLVSWSFGRNRTPKHKGGRALAVKLLPPFGFVWLRAACLPKCRRHVRLGHRPSKGAGFSINKRSKYLFVLVATNAQTQASNDFVILLNVRLLQVIEQTSAMLDHLQQSASRMIVFLVRLEVLGEFANALT
jgi:hypothetical protein